MQLIMENWRNYVAEVESEDRYGYLYLFEGDSVKKVSFHQRLKSLNESEGDFELFLEEWEKSVTYQLDRLDEASIEAAHDAYLKTQAQAWNLLTLDLPKAKDKVFAYAKNLKKKLMGDKQIDPKIAKIAKVSLAGLTAALAVGGAMALINTGMEPQDAVDLGQNLNALDPGAGDGFVEAAKNLTPEALSDVVDKQQDIIKQAAAQLETAPAAPPEIADKAQEIWQDDPFGDLMAEFEAEDAAAPGEAAYGPGGMENLIKQMTPEERETYDILGDMLDQKMAAGMDDSISDPVRDFVEEAGGSEKAKKKIAQKLSQLSQKFGKNHPEIVKKTKGLRRAGQVLFTPEKFEEREKEAAFEVFKDLIAQKEAAGR